MGDLFSKLLEIAFGKRARWFWATVIIIIVLALVLYPYIDANILAYNRINNKIELLDKISRLDLEAIKKVPELREEYAYILTEINSSREKSITQISTSEQQSTSDCWIKFTSGSVLFFIVSIIMLFTKGDKELSKGRRIANRLGGFLVCIAFGCGLGVLATRIPTFINVWVNAVLFPVVLITILALLVYTPKKKSQSL